MSNEHFGRVDGRSSDRAARPDDGDIAADRKAKIRAIIEYRDAYLALAARDPDAVRGLPDPDADPRSFDPAAALASLRAQGGKLRGVPPTDVTT